MYQGQPWHKYCKTSDNRVSRLIGPNGAYTDVARLSGIYCSSLDWPIYNFLHQAKPLGRSLLSIIYTNLLIFGLYFIFYLSIECLRKRIFNNLVLDIEVIADRYVSRVRDTHRLLVFLMCILHPYRAAIVIGSSIKALSKPAMCLQV